MANKIHKPVLAIVAGPNGSGKTTITEALLKHKWLDGCEYINPDNIANSLGDWNKPDTLYGTGVISTFDMYSLCICQSHL